MEEDEKWVLEKLESLETGKDLTFEVGMSEGRNVQRLSNDVYVVRPNNVNDVIEMEGSAKAVTQELFQYGQGLVGLKSPQDKDGSIKEDKGINELNIAELLSSRTQQGSILKEPTPIENSVVEKGKQLDPEHKADGVEKVFDSSKESAIEEKGGIREPSEKEEFKDTRPTLAEKLQEISPMVAAQNESLSPNKYKDQDRGGR